HLILSQTLDRRIAPVKNMPRSIPVPVRANSRFFVRGEGTHMLLVRRTVAICSVLFTVSAFADERPDILVADFEGDDYGAWKVEGSAFGNGPARGTLPGQMPVSGFLGKGLVNSFVGGDDSTGKLTSPPFRIERKHVNFLIGGGKYPGQTCINLLVDGKIV